MSDMTGGALCPAVFFIREVFSWNLRQRSRNCSAVSRQAAGGEQRHPGRLLSGEECPGGRGRKGAVRVPAQPQECEG